MHRLLHLMMFGALLLFPGCGQATHSFDGCGVQTDAKILLLWTVRGQPATATGCQGIDQLDLVLSPDQCSGSVEIAPIPCERDGAGWRYDDLPRGGATVDVTAKDATGRAVLHGSTRVTLGPTLPASPAPLELN